MEEEAREDAAATSDTDRPVLIDKMVVPEFANGSNAQFQQHKVRINQCFCFIWKVDGDIDSRETE